MRATLERGWQMREVEVKKDKLLTTLRKNRERHIRDFKESVAGYYDQCLKLLKDKISEVEKLSIVEPTCDSPMVQLYFNLRIPQSHEKDYDQAIQMLEWEIADTVKITSDQFACYVMDDWDWRHDFEVQKSFYNSRR